MKISSCIGDSISRLYEENYHCFEFELKTHYLGGRTDGHTDRQTDRKNQHRCFNLLGHANLTIAAFTRRFCRVLIFASSQYLSVIYLFHVMIH